MAAMEEQHAGSLEVLNPLVRRLLAPNPSPFTFTGTQTFIVGKGEVAVIDPGPDLPLHVEALLSALAGERVTAILCTHTHRDHSPASRSLQAATGAPIIGCAALALEDDELRADDSFDPDYAPDRVMEEGDRLQGDGWTLEAIATPGHTSNHLCFAFPEQRTLFTGDHVMGWSTSIVSPPDGDMGDYVRSLEKLQAREDAIYYPAHGPAVEDPRKLVRGLILHRKQREAQIVAQLERGEGRIPSMVASMYKDVDPRLHLPAGRSVLAHLIDLKRRGIARLEGDAWSLVS